MATIALVLSLLLIGVATLAPYGALTPSQMPPRWCLRCGSLWLTDVISNVVLFAPFGMSLAARGVRPWRCLLAGAALSLLIEWLQSVGIPPMRSAAAADVLSNTAGGALGALLMVHGRTMAFTPPRLARALAWSWSAATVLALALTSAALGPRAETHEASADPAPSRALHRSPYRHVPGSGWFEGFIDSATVDAYRVTQRGTGPIIVEAPERRASLRITAYTRGRDVADATVPIVFVHAVGDSSPIAMLAQRERDAVLVVTRRAWDWGLAMPRLQVPMAFTPRTDGANDTLTHRTLSATITNASLALRVSGDVDAPEARLALTPLLGWTLIQTVIPIESPFAFVARLGWCLLLAAPIGWWSARTLRPAGTLAGCVALVAAGALIAPRLAGTAPMSWGEAAALVAVCASAMVVSSRPSVRLWIRQRREPAQPHSKQH